MKELRDRYLLPEFPRTPHLPLNQNMTEGDVLADSSVIDELLKRNDVILEEKVDGANVGICYYKGQFHIRNRSHILKKGFLHKTPAGQQFRPLWNWCYQHQGNFQLLNRMEPFSEEEPATIYGDWLWMAHGIHYTRLKDFLVAYDVYDARAGTMIHDHRAMRQMLREAGFETPQNISSGHIHTPMFLVNMSRSASELYNGLVEGIYIRCRDWDTGGTKRYKMVRDDFQRGVYFRESEIIRNLKVKE